MLLIILDDLMGTRDGRRPSTVQTQDREVPGSPHIGGIGKGVL